MFPAKNLPQDIPPRLKIPTDIMNPVLYLYTKLYYEEYIDLIWRIGKGAMLIHHVIKLSRKSYSTVWKDLKEMEQLNLINIDKPINNSYVRLKANALNYLKEEDNNRDIKPLSPLQLKKKIYLGQISEIYNDQKVFVTEERYLSFLMFLLMKSYYKDNIQKEMERLYKLKGR